MTLGTHPQPMDRVVRAVDDLVSDGHVREPVVIQSATFALRPRHALAAEIVPFEQLQAWIAEARVVVTHGGPGTIMQVLAAGKAPRVIPRDHRLGEHVDDHQQGFVRWLAARRPIFPIWQIEDLGAALEPGPIDAAVSLTASSTAVSERLIALVEGG